LRFEPGSYLELIAWHELTPITAPEHLPHHFPSDFLRKDTDEEVTYYPQWVVWEAGEAAEGRILRHHIVPEEEVYGHYLIGNWSSAGYLQDGKVVFTLVPLEQSTFLSDINTYWSVWVRISMLVFDRVRMMLL